MNRSASIIAEMRNELRSTIANENSAETVEAQDAARRIKVRRLQAGYNLSGERYPVATRIGRENAAVSSAILLRGTEDADIRNAQRRDFSIPRRAMSMCSSRGRVTPDAMASLLAYFSNPSSLTEAIYLSILPERPSYARLVEFLADNGIEATEAEIKALKLFGSNRGMRDGGGAPRQVKHYTPGVEVPAEVKRGRGRPAGAKVVGYLPTATYGHLVGTLLQGVRPTYGPVEAHLIPGGNDAAQGEGLGYGNEVWSDGSAGWSHRFATPAQRARRNAALDRASHGYRTIDGEVVERW